MSETASARLRRHWSGSTAPAVVWAEGAWSGEELLRRAGGAAAWLDDIGAPAAIPVAALLDESPAAIALAVGALLSGRALAPLGTKLPRGELAAALRGLDARALVTDPGSAALARGAAAGSGVPVFLLDAPPELGETITRPATGDDIAAVIHTSGTTGRPQPVFQRQAELAARTRIYGSAIELEAGDRYCSASPFYHVAGMGMTLVALGAGASVIPFAGFSVEGWRALGDLEPTHALLVPTMIDMLLEARALDIGLRVLQYGAAPIHPATLAAAMAAVPATRLIQIFGQTEVSPITRLSHADHRRARDEPRVLESVGRACDEVELRIDEPDGEGIGELLVRAPHVFAVGEDGWRHTGDLGFVDDDGLVYLRGRRGDRIVRGGENIYPAEIETVIALHPAVMETCVVGQPDRRWGEVVKAVVVVRGPRSEAVADEIRALVRDRLAHFKVPTTVEFVDALPRTPTGKVRRQELRSGYSPRTDGGVSAHG